MRALTLLGFCAWWFGCSSSSPGDAVSQGGMQLIQSESPSAGICALEFRVVDTTGREVAWASMSVHFEDSAGTTYDRVYTADEIASLASLPILPAGGSTTFSITEPLSTKGLLPSAQGTIVLTGIFQSPPMSTAAFSLDARCDSF